MVVVAVMMYGCSSPVGLPDQEPTAITEVVQVDESATMTPTAPDQPSPTPTIEGSPEPVTAETEPASTPSATPATDMQTLPTAAPETDKATQEVAAENTDCINQAIFVDDVTIPDGTSIPQGTAFEKVWRIKNSGTCTWDGYSLVFAGGDIMNAGMSNPLPVVKPGEFGDISLELTAPARGGLRTGNWIFQDASGEGFGLGHPSSGTLWVQINVGWQSTGSTDTTTGEVSGNIDGCAVIQDPAYINQVLELVNQARTASGLSVLRLNDQLSQAALGHSTDMACNGFVDHNGSDGSTWYQRASAAGYSNSASALENLYVGDPAFGGTAQGAFEWWMNSQVHRDNILTPNLNDIGIGYVYLAGSQYGGYFTILLARSI
jgi:uncharacterized protein YkwD